MNYLTSYCSNCDYLGTDCKKSCHGKRFFAKSENGFNPIGGVYVPKGSEWNFSLLVSISRNLHPLKGNEPKLHSKVCIIDYAGKGSRKVFKGFGIYSVDFGLLHKTYCELAIITCLAHFGTAKELTGPHNFKPDSRTIYYFGSNRD